MSVLGLQQVLVHLVSKYLVLYMYFEPEFHFAFIECRVQVVFVVGSHLVIQKYEYYSTHERIVCLVTQALSPTA